MRLFGDTQRAHRVEALGEAPSDAIGPRNVPDLAVWYDAAQALTDGAVQIVATSGQYLSAPSSSSLQMGGKAFTAAFWAYFDTAPIPGQERYCAGKWSAAPAGEWYCSWHGTSNRLRFTTSNGTTYISTTANQLGAPSVGTWYHVVCTYDPATTVATIFVNDNAGDAAPTVTLVSTAHPLSLGNSPTLSSAASHDGRLDSVGIWDRILTSAERTWLWNNGSGRTSADLTSAMVSGLVAWYDLDESSGTRYDSRGANHLAPSASDPPLANGIAASLATEGDPIKSLLDLSGNGRHAVQTTLASKPTLRENQIGGRPVARFDGLDDHLQASGVPLPAQMTLLAVVREDSSTNTLFIEHSADSSVNNGFHIFGGGIAPVRIRRGGTNITAPNNANWVGTSAAVVGTRYNGATLEYARNGVIAGAIADTLPNNGLVTTTLNVGSRNGGSFFFGGQLAELIVYSRPLSDSEVDLVERYLGAKYGIGVT